MNDEIEEIEKCPCYKKLLEYVKWAQQAYDCDKAYELLNEINEIK